jgi:ribosome-binding ATPase YchF (GTP1/OBG family)
MSYDLSIALAGLPNVGKSLLFNLITGQCSEVSPYPLSTPRPVQGVCEFVDWRVPKLTDVIRPAQVFPLRVLITDTNGMSPGNYAEREGTAESLASLRAADVLAYVLRSFDEPSASTVFSDEDFYRDAKAVSRELCTVDLQLVDARIAQLDRMIRRGRKDTGVLAEFDTLVAARESLAGETPLVTGFRVMDQSGLGLFDGLNLITHKPRFYVLNYGEEHVSEYSSRSDWRHQQPFVGVETVAVCGRLESDLLKLALEDRADFLDLYPGLVLTSHEIIQTALSAAGRISYFTYGHLGLKHWSVPSGTTAVGAAKRLHTDFAARFIAAEVTTAEKMIEAGRVDELKSRGKLRLEGKDYQVRDGDVLYFRFGH